MHFHCRIRDCHMKSFSPALGLAPLLLLIAAGIAHAERPAEKHAATIDLFKNAGECASFFSRSYGYAVFPTIGEGGLVVGGAHGKGRVYVHGVWAGNTAMNQLSIGFQAGGKAYSEIIFFEDKRALDQFESGSFEFSAGASAVAITAGASASAGTTGASAGMSGGKKDARATGVYENGMAVFTIAKGGLMYAVTLAGQKFSYTPRSAS